MKKLFFILSLFLSLPLSALASTDVNFDTTSTGATSSYLANSLNAYWHDNTNGNLIIGNSSAPSSISQSGGGANGLNILGIGKGSLNSVTTGNTTIAIGPGAADSLTTGAVNVAIGHTMHAITTGSNNVAIGDSILAVTVTGGGASSENTVIGSGALSISLFGVSNGNTVIGRGAANNMSSGGSNNTVIGNHVGNSGSYSGNILIGTDSTTQSAASNYLNIGGGAIQGTGLGGTPDIGISVSSPTARVQFPAGAAGSHMAPIKLTPGTLMTTPEDGALEYDGTHLYFTIGSTRSPIL